MQRKDLWITVPDALLKTPPAIATVNQLIAASTRKNGKCCISRDQALKMLQDCPLPQPKEAK